MKRAILVLMIVVFALVTVVPTFALSQDFHGITVPQIIDPNDGIGVPQVVDPNDGIIVDYASLNFTRKAGGEQQDYL